jgi:hypothetical protein
MICFSNASDHRWQALFAGVLLDGFPLQQPAVFGVSSFCCLINFLSPMAASGDRHGGTREHAERAGNDRGWPASSVTRFYFGDAGAVDVEQFASRFKHPRVVRVASVRDWMNVRDTGVDRRPQTAAAVAAAGSAE